MKCKKLIFGKLRRATFIVLFLSIGTFAFGQSGFQVGQIQKLNITGYNVKLSPQGDKLLYSQANFGGLRLYNIEKQKDIEITDKRGSGYQARISNDRIYYKPKDADKFITVSFDDQLDNIVVINQNEQEQTDFQEAENGQNVIANPSEDLYSIIVKVGQDQPFQVAPLGKNNYLNVSVSPDGSKLLFRVSGIATFVSTLDGQIIKKFDDAEFPSWFSNEEVLYAKVEDDGHNYTSSDLFIAALKSDKKVNLTANTKAIGLYPSAGADVVAFNTPEGEIYLIKLTK
jgi:hypothetical protein